ncbi:MAG: ribosome silencing factor [Firmicutes bacterium]|nr:ribosome silencing factor [Bacillota bacterium]
MVKDTKEIAEIAVKALEHKKAKDIVLLGIYKVSTIADFFVIASGASFVQVKALADEVDKKMFEAGINLHHKEGYSDARWVLLDYGDVVVHIFHDRERAFYDLERLWRDAEKVELDILDI